MMATAATTLMELAAAAASTVADDRRFDVVVLLWLRGGSGSIEPASHRSGGRAVSIATRHGHAYGHGRRCALIMISPRARHRSTSAAESHVSSLAWARELMGTTVGLSDPISSQALQLVVLGRSTSRLQSSSYQDRSAHVRAHERFSRCKRSIADANARQCRGCSYAGPGCSCPRHRRRRPRTR